jgi:hypothetical protein
VNGRHCCFKDVSIAFRCGEAAVCRTLKHSSAPHCPCDLLRHCIWTPLEPASRRCTVVCSISLRALLAADDPNFDSPYVKAAREAGMDLPWWEKVAAGKFENGKFFLKKLTGGKLDDITVVVARVSDAPPVVEEVPEVAEASETTEEGVDAASTGPEQPVTAEAGEKTEEKTDQ